MTDSRISIMVLRSSVMGMRMLFAAARAIAYVAGERIGEMGVMMRVVQAVHQRDIGLPGQHKGERHAEHGYDAANRGKPVLKQRVLAAAKKPLLRAI